MRIFAISNMNKKHENTDKTYSSLALLHWDGLYSSCYVMLLLKMKKQMF